MSRSVLVVGSLVAHGAMVLALGRLRAAEVRPDTAIEMTEAPAKAEPPAPEPAPAPEPPAPQPAARAPAPRAPSPTPAPAKAQAEAAQASAESAPDLGLELSGGTGPGLAVAAPSHAAPRAAAAPVQRTLAAPAPKVADACAEPPAKPRLKDLPRPVYTEDARSAGIEGKVRVEITVDETGKVASVRALTSLGHGLDEAALSAARAATFEPAVRCGKPSRSTFTVAIRFSA